MISVDVCKLGLYLGLSLKVRQRQLALKQKIIMDFVKFSLSRTSKYILAISFEANEHDHRLMRTRLTLRPNSLEASDPLK